MSVVKTQSFLQRFFIAMKSCLLFKFAFHSGKPILRNGLQDVGLKGLESLPSEGRTNDCLPLFSNCTVSYECCCNVCVYDKCWIP